MAHFTRISTSLSNICSIEIDQLLEYVGPNNRILNIVDIDIDERKL